MKKICLLLLTFALVASAKTRVVHLAADGGKPESFSAHLDQDDSKKLQNYFQPDQSKKESALGTSGRYFATQGGHFVLSVDSRGAILHGSLWLREVDSQNPELTSVRRNGANFRSFDFHGADARTLFGRLKAKDQPGTDSNGTHYMSRSFVDASGYAELHCYQKDANKFSCQVFINEDVAEMGGQA